jgi:SAM-dependent methyltransferase
LFGKAALFTCERCQLVQAAPAPDDDALDEYYTSAYWSGTHEGTPLDDGAVFPRDNEILFQRGHALTALAASHLYRTPLVALDIGAGRGHALHAIGARYPGIQRVALEPSSNCRRHLESIGVLAVGDSIEAFLQAHAERFDVVIMSHVVEHFARPLEVLRLVASSMRPGGVVCIEVPNASVEDDRLRHPWVSRFDEPHLSFFSPDSLRNLLERVGFTVVIVETAGPVYERASLKTKTADVARALVRRLFPRSVVRRISRQRRGIGAEAHPPDGDQARIWIRCVARKAA